MNDRVSRWLVIALVALIAGCASEMKMSDQYSMKYLQSRAGKPIIYPSGVTPVEHSSIYNVPPLSGQAATTANDPDDLATPPRLVPKPGDHDGDISSVEAPGNEDE